MDRFYLDRSAFTTVESTVEEPKVPIRRIVLEIPDDKAVELAKAIDDGIVWCQTSVRDELGALHEALGGWRY